MAGNELKLYERRVFEQESTGIGTVDIKALDAEGRGLMAIGRAFGRMDQQQKRAKAAEDVAKANEAVNRYRVDTDKWIEASTRDPGGYPNLEDNYTEYHKEKLDSILEGLDDEKVRRLVSTKLGQLSADNQIEVNGIARKQQIQFAQQATTKSLSVMSRRAIEANNIFDLSEVLDEMETLIDVQTSLGIYDPVTGQKTLKNYRDDIAVSRVRKDMAVDAETTYNQLLDPNGYPDLPEGRRATLAETARKRVEQDEKQKERDRLRRNTAEERAIKIRQDTHLASGYSMLLKNELTEPVLEQWRRSRLVNASGYKQLRDGLTASLRTGGTSDPRVFNQYQAMAYAGEASITDILNNENLNYEDAKTLIPIIENGAAFFKEPDYKRAKQHIRQILGAEGVTVGHFKIEDSPLVANATRELYDQVLKSGGIGIWDIADNIVERYQKRQKGLPSRRRWPEISKSELKAMLSTKKISDHEYNMEVGLLEQEAKRMKPSTVLPEMQINE